MDLHHNLFYSYRGPNTGDGDRERQLENNVTKALINTLQLGEEAVWRPFLTECGLPDASNAAFLLQRQDLPSGLAAHRQHRVLLGISAKPTYRSASTMSVTPYDSVPDAWIYGDGFAVLVESKVVGDFSDGQMQAHLARLQSSGQPQPTVILKTWRELHSFFRRLLPDLPGVSALLVKQFIQFLEYSEMSGFTGFEREHFNYFLSHDDNDARRWVSDQVADFAAQVRVKLFEFNPFYEDHEIGSLKISDSDCWVAFGPRDSAYRKVTHQTMALGANGLRIFVNAELKSATDRLKNVLRQSAHSLRAALHELHMIEPYELVLEERFQRQASLYDQTPKMRLHSSLLADEATGDVAWMALAHTALRLPLLNLKIERRVPPERLLQLSKDDAGEAVEFVATILRRNHKLVELLNGG